MSKKNRVIILLGSTFVLFSIFSTLVYLFDDRHAVYEGYADVEFSKIDTFYDISSKLTLDHLSAARFEPSSNYISLGYMSGTLWYRLALKHPAEGHSGQALLVVSIPNLDHISLNYRDTTGEWVTLETGDSFAFSERPWASPRLGFSLSLDNLGNDLLYLGIKSAGTVAVSVSIGDFSSVSEENRWYHFFAFIFFLLLILIAMVTAFLYYVYGSTVFLIFFFNQVIYLVAAVSYLGYLSALFPYLVTDRITMSWLLMATFSTIFFHTYFFKILNAKPIVHRLQILILFLYLFFITIGYFLDPLFSLKASWCLASIFTIIMVVGSWTLGPQAYLSIFSVRLIYTLLGFSLIVWLFPVIGVIPATKLAFYGPGMHSLLNISLVLSMIMKFATNEKELNNQKESYLNKLKYEADVQKRMSLLYQDLLWTITHEVGTGLSVFKLGLARQELNSRDRERMARSLKALEGILDKFTFSERLESNSFPLTSTVVDVVHLIKEEVDTIADESGGVEFEVINMNDHASNFVTDIDLLRIVFNNLLGNSAKYSQLHTKISVCVSIENSVLMVTILNSCPEASLPDVGRVFDRFYRGRKVLDRSGSGLGLYLVQGILKLLSGWCTFEIVDMNMVRVTIWVPSAN